MSRITEVADWVNKFVSDRFTYEAAVNTAVSHFGITRDTVLRYCQKAKKMQGMELPEQQVSVPDTYTVSENDILRQNVKDLQKQLRVTQKHAVTTETIRKEIFKLSDFDFTPPPWLSDAKWPRDSYPGIPTLDLSDIHWSEVVTPGQVFGLNEYNSEIARTRLQYVVDKAIGILQNYITPAKYPGIVLILGGDMLSGEIHEELTQSNDNTMMGAALDCAENLGACVKRLTAAFGKVHIYGVAGNHSRTSRKPRMKFYAETNFDWLIYQMLERFILSECKGVTCTFPPARDLTYELLGHRFRLTHGDQFRGGDGMIGALGPIIRGDKKKRASALTMPGQHEIYDTLVVHHFHQTLMRPNLIVNGSLKGYDEFGMALGFDFEPPIQNLWITHPRWGINYNIPLIADPNWKGEGE